ncbi:MAG: 4Fe-4S binding protein [Treponema sp.]|jgi:dissimilatory sulfite reductase (desulfoviridin) alpha/beta subunit|nr:4Fe-4S binding protein [Treponema sp.]
MPEIDYVALKKSGFFKQKQENKCSLRVKALAGMLQADQVKKVGELAEQYGQGYVHFTSRQNIEIPFISFDAIETIKKELAASGMQTSGGGLRVRPVTACQGGAICSFGLIDTTALTQEVDRRFYGQELPCKLKIAITGCSNNCARVEANDIGIKGGLVPTWNNKNCSFCGRCAESCPGNAITVDKEKKSLGYDENKCLFCGKCAKTCSGKAWTGEKGFRLYFGGFFGNEISIGKQYVSIILDTEKVLHVLDAVLVFFGSQAKKGERLGKTIARVGAEQFQKTLEDALSQ